MAARVRIIVLDGVSLGENQGKDWRVALWADVPLSRQPFYANASAVSVWLQATAGDLAALQAGEVAERVVVLKQNPGATVADMQSAASAAWTEWQTYITARNPWNVYGTTYNTDGTWTMAGVA